MKIIDRTPYLSENGQISFPNQVLAVLKYGSSWYPGIQAQEIVVTTFNHGINKGYTLFRNITLPSTDISLPLVLVGPSGVYLLNVTHLKGTFQAKGDSWEEIQGGRTKPTRNNLLILTSRMAGALQRYINMGGIELSSVEGILIASDPGLHVDGVHPIVRVVMRDAIGNLVVSINSTKPTLSQVMGLAIVELLTGPEASPAPDLDKTGDALFEESDSQSQQDFPSTPELSELLPWSQEVKSSLTMETSPIDREGIFDFEQAFKPDASLEEPAPQRVPGRSNSRKVHFNLRQWILLIFFGMVEIIILLIFFWLVYSNL
jgi:hypothetical protein